jgi:hypothetical protein
MEIKLNGVGYEWKYNMAGVSEVAEELQSNNLAVQMYAVFFAGIYGSAVVSRKAPALTYEQLVNEVDKTPERAEIFNLLIEEINRVSPEFVAKVDDEKKKATKKLSTTT